MRTRNCVSLKNVDHLIELLKPRLAGHPPELQGAALADLLATWLAGHVIAGDRDTTLHLRAELLANHIAAVTALVPINAKILGID